MFVFFLRIGLAVASEVTVTCARLAWSAASTAVHLASKGKAGQRLKDNEAPASKSEKCRD